MAGAGPALPPARGGDGEVSPGAGMGTGAQGPAAERGSPSAHGGAHVDGATGSLSISLPSPSRAGSP